MKSYYQRMASIRNCTNANFNLMIKYLASKVVAQNIISYLGSLYILFVHKSSKIKFKDRKNINGLFKKDESFIYSFWHDQLLMCPLTWQNRKPIRVLISKHRDGDIISKVISHLGFSAIRGSTHKSNKTKNKGGLLSARKMIKSLQGDVCIGISPDGPKGPRHKVSDGIISIAKLSNAVIVPVGIGFKNKWKLNTWDQFIIPKPFNEITVIWGKPIEVDKKNTNIKSTKETLENLMNDLTKRANKGYN